MKIEVNIPSESIEAAVIEALTRNSMRLDGKTSLGGIVAKAIEDQAESLRERVDSIVSGVIRSDELERRIRAAFRASVVHEAEKIGRQVARAMAMADAPTASLRDSVPPSQPPAGSP